MDKKLPTIKIDLDKKCPMCGNPGAIIGRDGSPTRCLDCVVTAMKAGVKGATEHLPDYWPVDPEIETMAARLIDAYHGEAAGAKICYLFRKKHTKANGQIRLGTCQKQSSKNHLLNGYDYVIEFAWDAWQLLESFQREALVLHELLHVFKDGETAPTWKIEPHNVEEFSKVIEVYGLWQPNLEHLAASIEKFEKGPGLRQISFQFGKAANE